MKAKTPGQVGYEAMLKLIRANPEIYGYDKRVERSPDLDEQIGAWENQSDELKADWEHVAQAVVAWERDRFLGEL